MELARIFSIDQNIFQIYNNKNIKLFDKDLIDIALKSGRNIKKFEKHDLILKITILSSKNNLLFVVFIDFYLIIDICLI